MISGRLLFPMRFVALLGFCAFLAGFLACEKLSIEPDEFNYPLSLTVTQNRSLIELTWSEASVSTFEEYFIIRSTEPISDTPEPETDGNAFIIERIDQRTLTHFKDETAPLSSEIYYKVYAKIAGRFLMSPTIHIDLQMQVVQIRTDAAYAIPEEDLLIGYDRVGGRLFFYDYVRDTLLKSAVVTQFNSPMIRVDRSAHEVLVGDGGSVYIYDMETMQQKGSFFPGAFRDIQFEHGWIYLETAGNPNRLTLYKRSNFSQTDQLSVLTADWRRTIVQVDQESPFKATVYDFGLQGSARYLQNGGDLMTDFSNPNPILGSQVIPAMRPGRNEFITSNTGVVLNAQLAQEHLVDNGRFSFSQFAYSPDGSTLYGLTFTNATVIRSYDAEDAYKFIDEQTLNNQLSPIYLFSDDTGLRVVSIVFLGSAWSTLITTFEHL